MVEEPEFPFLTYRPTPDEMSAMKVCVLKGRTREPHTFTHFVDSALRSHSFTYHTGPDCPLCKVGDLPYSAAKIAVVGYEQFRFPRSKKKRIRNKWRKNSRNWRAAPGGVQTLDVRSRSLLDKVFVHGFIDPRKPSVRSFE